MKEKITESKVIIENGEVKTKQENY